MPDLIKPISSVATQIETRAFFVGLRNKLDVTGIPGTPGKYRVSIETVDEKQTADGRPSRDAAGNPERTNNPAVTFDPMDYAATEIPGTGRTLGAIMQDMLAAVAHFKGGLPPAPEKAP